MEIGAYTKTILSETWQRRDMNRRVLRKLAVDKRVLDDALNGAYATPDSRLPLSQMPFEDLMAATPDEWRELGVALKGMNDAHTEWHEAMEEADQKHYRGLHQLRAAGDWTLSTFLEQPSVEQIMEHFCRYITDEEAQASDYLLSDYRLTRGGTARGDMQVIRSLAQQMKTLSPSQRDQQTRAYMAVMQQDYEQTMLFRLFRRTREMQSIQWDATPADYVAFYLERRTADNIPAFIKFLRYYRNRYWLMGDTDASQTDIHRNHILDEAFPLSYGRQCLPPPIAQLTPLSTNRDVAMLQQQNELLRKQADGLKAELAMAVTVGEIAQYCIDKEDRQLADTLKLAVYEIKKSTPGTWSTEFDRVDEAFRREREKLLREAAQNGLTEHLYASGAIHEDHSRSVNISTTPHGADTPSLPEDKQKNQLQG